MEKDEERDQERWIDGGMERNGERDEKRDREGWIDV